MRNERRANQQAMLALIQHQPLAAALLLQRTEFIQLTRVEQMALELGHALQHTSGADLANLAVHVVNDVGAAAGKRVSGLFDLLVKLAGGLVDEGAQAKQAYTQENLAEHLGVRMGMSINAVSAALSNGKNSLMALGKELAANPVDAAPKLLVLVLSSVVVSGGIDGNGGLPDSDIQLWGIGEHRSPFTHSILIGSMLEAAVLLLTRIVLCTHKNLPVGHDPLWNGIAGKSSELLIAAGKGASVGLAYHLMVDAVVQPGAYHGLPFDMPIEGHQALLGVNALAEGQSSQTYPDKVALANATPAINADHKRFRAIRIAIPLSVSEWLTPQEIDLLSKYGSWLQALAERKIPPTTENQLQFIKVADKEAAAVSSHELAWTALENAKELSGFLKQPVAVA